MYLEQLYYRRLGVRKEHPQTNPLAAGLLIAASIRHIRKHGSVIEGHPLPKTGAAILTGNHHREADTYKGVQLCRDAGRLPRAVLRASLIDPKATESAEYLASIGNKQDKLNRPSRLRAFVLRGVGTIPIMRDDPGHDFFRPCNETLERGQMLSIFIQSTRHEDCLLKDLQPGAAFVARMNPDVPVYAFAFSGPPDGLDKVTILKPFTYNELGKKLSVGELTIMIADMLAEALPERVRQDWQIRRAAELKRLTAPKRTKTSQTT